MNTATNQTFDIQGTQFNYNAATSRIALSAACIGLGIFFWPLREHTFWGLDSPDAQAGAWVVAAIPWIIAAILPYKAHTYLDFANGQIVTLKHYGWFPISNRSRLLKDFGRIVMRLVCHAGSEGPDTFAGSVGLKPSYGGAVFWLKEFSTTQDEMPREAYEFAISLQARLRLPVIVLGMEFLDLEKADFFQSKTSAESDQGSRSVSMSRPPGVGLSFI